MTAPLTPLERQGHWQFANSLGLLVIRLVLGWTFVYHGSQKLFDAFGAPPGMINVFADNLKDMPVLPAKVWAYMAAVGEFGGGLLVLLGLLARLGTLPIIVTMIVAIAKVHGKYGFSHSPPEAGYEFNLNLIAMAVAIMVAGPGLISLDALIFKRSLWAKGPQPLGNPVPR